ncbi:MAG: type VI secretion system baseplate subunit TssF, partial [Pseudomonadales bacterium]
MSDQAMRYYERELAYIRKALGEFADEHPEQAAQLQLGRSSVEDPNISRMIDGMALLTAKTEQRLDQQFPDLVQDLFTLLYPGMLEPTASYFPLRLAPLAEQMKEPQTLRAGALLSANTPDGENCHFTTVADLKVYPYLLCDVSAQAAPFTTLAPKSLHGAQAVIQLRLDCADPQANFSQLELGDLEFYVDGFEGNAEPLIDLLLEQTCCISVSDLAGEQHRELALEQLVNRATQTDFQWLSTHANQFSGFDLLRDYFSYPDKSAYFVLQGFAAAAAHFESAHLVLNIYLKTLPAEFLRLFNDQVFSLYTVPAINRFTQLAEPLQYDASALSMPVIADAENSSAEVLRVDAVYEIDAYGQQRLSPLCKQRYAEGERRRRWQCRQ